MQTNALLMIFNVLPDHPFHIHAKPNVTVSFYRKKNNQAGFPNFPNFGAGASR